MMRTGIALALLLLGTALPACASDAAPEPEPALEQAGAFVAVDHGEASLELFRTLSTLYIESGDAVLFMTQYDVAPATWDEAREIAKSHDIPMEAPITFLSRDVLVRHPYRVVWFRTLSAEEEARIP